MNRESQDYVALANLKLIAQVAGYYNSTKRDIENYRVLNVIELEQMSIVHLMHWKKELHSLIFNGMNCSERYA